MRRGSVGFALLLLGLTAAALVGHGVEGLGSAWSEPEALRTPTGLLGPCCALSAGLLLGWVWLGALLCALGQIPGAIGHVSSVLSCRVAPALLRAGVVAALGGSLVAGSGGIASADELGGALPEPGWAAISAAPVTASAQGAAIAQGATGGVAAEPPSALPGPGWTPTAPAAPPSTPSADIGLVSPSPAPGRTVDEHVVVRRGETLWAIAARHLGPDATAAEIAQAWPRWYAANRQLIGADPDRIRPGQLLRPPTDQAADQAESTTQRGRS